jgi:hypothetical protein
MQEGTGLIVLILPNFPYINNSPKRRTVLRPGLAVIVSPRGGDVGMTEPFLHIRDIGLRVERVGGGRCRA